MQAFQQRCGLLHPQPAHQPNEYCSIKTIITDAKIYGDSVPLWMIVLKVFDINNPQL